MAADFRTQELAVGYNRQFLIQGINIHPKPGKILTLIGPNGAGKSTILKTITRQLEAIHGLMFIGNRPLNDIPMKEFAKQTAVVLTERIQPELMTCAEVVAMGRYPYTNMFGSLSREDKKIVSESLERVHALELADQDFSTLSDGQRQRIMLARAICQDPEILVLDEPTAFLDIRYKIEILDILQKMAREQGTTVIMSLHEIDLAMKISDELLCLDGERIAAYGPTDEVMTLQNVEDLFEIKSGSYNLLFGSVELPKPVGNPSVFVVCGNGKGTPYFRALQKQGTPFAAGILYENDIDCQTADVLSNLVIKAPAFEPISEELILKAQQVILTCRYVLNAGGAIGTFNNANRELIEFAKKNNIPVLTELQRIENGL